MTFSGGYRNGTLGEKRLIQTGCLFIEVFTSRCSIKSCFEKFGKFHREAPTLTFFLVKLKRKPLHLFSCQFYDVLQNYYSMEQLWKSVSVLRNCWSPIFAKTLISDTQPAFTCSKSTMETPEQFKKAVQINNKGTRTTSQSNNKDNRRRHRRRYGVFIVRFEQISDII